MVGSHRFNQRLRLVQYIGLGLVITLVSAMVTAALLISWRKLTFGKPIGVAAGPNPR